MLNIVGVNGLVHWTEAEIKAREWLIDAFSIGVRDILLDMNRAWDIRRIEGPVLVPRDMVSSAYTGDDVYFQDGGDLALRPETTATTYAWMNELLSTHSGARLPLCVWQAGKSFRREQDQPTKFMRLKEFHQLEFQCAYSADTANDYHANCLDGMLGLFDRLIPQAVSMAASDRLPDYAETTMDIEADLADRRMELCSISRRKDFPTRWRDRDVLVLEIAIGLDRCVWCMESGVRKVMG